MCQQSGRRNLIHLIPSFPILLPHRLRRLIPRNPPKIYFFTDLDPLASGTAKLSYDEWVPLNNKILVFEPRKDDGEADIVCEADEEATNADGRDYVPLYMGPADVEGGAGAWGNPCTNEGEKTDEAKEKKDHVSFFPFIVPFM